MLHGLPEQGKGFIYHFYASVELISFLAKHDTDLHYQLTTNKVFTGRSGKIQNDLICAIVMEEEITT